MTRPRTVAVAGGGWVCAGTALGRVRPSGRSGGACALIVVEGVRLYIASESMADWISQAEQELREKGIKVNKVGAFQFRIVAYLLFRSVLKVRDAVPGDRTIRAALALDPFSVAHDQ